MCARRLQDASEVKGAITFEKRKHHLQNRPLPATAGKQEYHQSCPHELQCCSGQHVLGDRYPTPPLSRSGTWQLLSESVALGRRNSLFVLNVDGGRGAFCNCREGGTAVLWTCISSESSTTVARMANIFGTISNPGGAAVANLFVLEQGETATEGYTHTSSLDCCKVLRRSCVTESIYHVCERRGRGTRSVGGLHRIRLAATTCHESFSST
eukprot:1070999-Rhodomonas_salina.2